MYVNSVDLHGHVCAPRTWVNSQKQPRFSHAWRSGRCDLPAKLPRYVAPMARQKEALTLSVPPGTKKQLDELAERLGYRWGDRPNASALITALADGSLAVGAGLRLAEAEQQALVQAINALIDNGTTEHARVLMEFLVAHGEPAEALRRKLLERLGNADDSRRKQIDEKIAARQPFYLYYKSARGTPYQFTVRFARVRFRERRSYLEIWCEETEKSADLPGLKHNRFLRLDRAQGLSVVASGGIWRDDLDHVEATFKLAPVLARDYEPDPDDLGTQVDGEALIVTRRTASAFWLLRELKAYGALCEVLAPPELRERMRQELCEAAGVYEGDA